MTRLLALPLAAALLSAACGKTPSSPTEGPPDPPGAATAADLQFCLDETKRYRSSIFFSFSWAAAKPEAGSPLQGRLCQGQTFVDVELGLAK